MELRHCKFPRKCFEHYTLRPANTAKTLRTRKVCLKDKNRTHVAPKIFDDIPYTK